MLLYCRTQKKPDDIFIQILNRIYTDKKGLLY